MPRGRRARQACLPHRDPVEQNDLGRLGEHRVPQLLGIAVDIAHVVGVDPAAAIRAGADIVEISDDLVALILLEKLVGDLRVARLGAGVDRVEHAGFAFEVVAQPLEVLVPIGIFDDHPDAGIDRARRLEHQVLRRFAHRIEPILRPAPRAFGGDVGVALARIEEEVVENHLVEVTRGALDRLPAFGAVGRALVVEGTELAALPALGQRDAARDDHTLALEKRFGGSDFPRRWRIRRRDRLRDRPCRNGSAPSRARTHARAAPDRRAAWSSRRRHRSPHGNSGSDRHVALIGRRRGRERAPAQNSGGEHRGAKPRHAVSPIRFAAQSGKPAGPSPRRELDRRQVERERHGACQHERLRDRGHVRS